MRYVLLLLTFTAVLASQVPTSAPAAATAAANMIDPLGRGTPRGTVLGFIRAAQYNKLRTAARYLQIPDSGRERNGPRLASQLHAILDQGWPSSFETISARPEGRIDDGVPPDRERAGAIFLPEGVYELLLTRVADPEFGLIWLVAAETVKQIPEMHKQVASPWLEEHLPAPLLTHVKGVALWQWLAPFALAITAAAILYAVWGLFAFIWRLRTGRPKPRRWWRVSLGPFYIIGVAAITALALRSAGVPALHRYYYGRILGTVAWVTAAWILWRGIDWAFVRSQSRLVARIGIGATSVLALGQRVLKVILVTLVSLAILNFLGFNVSAALAGLGIGGIAIALAAQKTLENLIGGVNILSDQVLHVGDSCKLGDRSGTVEDISLRSTRIRTDQGTLLAIPNGSVATMSIENLTGRTRFLFAPTISVPYETSSTQLHAAVDGIRKVLAQHPQVEHDSHRVRLLGFGASSINIEVNAMIRASSTAEFSQFREEIMFGIIEAVEAAGTSFAFPSQTVYLGKNDWPGDGQGSVMK